MAISNQHLALHQIPGGPSPRCSWAGAKRFRKLPTPSLPLGGSTKRDAISLQSWLASPGGFQAGRESCCCLGEPCSTWGSGLGEKVETTHEKCWKERRRKRVQAPAGLLLGMRGATSSSCGKSHSLRAPGGRGTLSLVPKRRRWAGRAQQSGGSQRRRGMKGRGGGIKPASPPREGHTGLSSVLGKGVPLEEEIFLHTVLVWVWQRQPGRFRPS